MGVNTTTDAKHSSDSEKGSVQSSWRDRLPSPQDLNFDIDKYLNRVVPQNQAKRLPLPVARWLGYRPQPVQEVGNLLIAAWACVGAIIGLLVVGAVYKYSNAIAELDPPVIFASLVSSPFQLGDRHLQPFRYLTLTNSPLRVLLPS